jgi:hypothetical protein
LDEFEPSSDPLSKLSLPGVFLDSQLSGQAERAEQRNALCAYGLIATPRQPRVQIQASRIARHLIGVI